MTDRPNKPGSTPSDTDDEQAVKNQGQTTPDKYPAPASGDDMGGKTR